MLILRPLLALPFLLPTALALTQVFSAGISKNQPPLPTTNVGLTLSDTNNFVIGPVVTTPFTFTVPEDSTHSARFTSPSRAGYLDLAAGDVAGFYELKWEDDVDEGAGAEFLASGCGCGGNCGGACVKAEGQDEVAGEWVLDERVAGTEEEWKLGYWNGTETKPEGLRSIILWRQCVGDCS